MQRRHEISFGQIYLARVTMTESDGTTSPMFPQEARLRNLTYAAPLYIDVKKRILFAPEDGSDGEWQPRYDDYGNELGTESDKVFIGKVSLVSLVRYMQ